MSEPYIEPWMRGPIPATEPLIMPVLYTFTHTREDLARHTQGITQELLWQKAPGIPSLGFHLRHIAGSVDRLTSYLMQRALTDDQLAFLHAEAEPGATLEELLAAIDQTFQQSERELRTIQPSQIHEPRGIGRKQLPTTVLGLVVHIAEHTQRHLGQAITTANLVKARPNRD